VPPPWVGRQRLRAFGSGGDADRLLRAAAPDKLRIAQVAPLFVRVPPARYGGTERVIYELTEELVRRGHDVTLFADATSETSGRLRAVAPVPLWELESHHRIPYQIAQVDEVVSSAQNFDVIHWHIDYMHWLLAGQVRTPWLTTLHGRLDSDSVRRLFIRYPGQPVVSISDAQRRPLAGVPANWIATVHHGLGLAQTYELGAGDGGYVAFVGRSSPEKGIVTAIKVAIRAGVPIKIAARVGESHKAYHEKEVVPLLGHPLVEWLGEVTESQKARLLAGAMALLMPIDWDEPFGLSFIEALAAGTPVITRPKGALPGLMRHGEHGFFAESEDELVDSCLRVQLIDRAACREWAISRFSTGRMVDAYESAYRRVLDPSAE
jgi:glycosyltransferase involved in cell wall biosynthesis